MVPIGEGLAKQQARGERVTRVCLDTLLEQATQAYARKEREEAEAIIAAFHSWDANGDGELQFDEFREMAAYSDPTLNPNPDPNPSSNPNPVTLPLARPPTPTPRCPRRL